MKTHGTMVIAAATLLSVSASHASTANNARSPEATVTGGKVVFQGLAGGPHVLFYEDFVLGTSAYQAALDALGWTVTMVTDPADFETELQTGAYTHVIAAHQNAGGASGWEDDLSAWAASNPGAPVLISDWRVDEPQPYLADLGFAYSGNVNLGMVEGTGGEALDGLAGALVNPGWGIFSYGVTGGTTIATDSPGSGKPMAVRNGCHFFNGFLSDTFLNGDVGRDVAIRELQCAAGGGQFELIGVTGDGSPTPESLFRIDPTDATIEFICGLGNGDDGETIGWNSTDGQLYHASGHDSEFDPKTLDGVVFEIVDDVGNGTSCATTNIDISTTDLIDEEAQALLWWPEENVFLWKQNHGPGPLFRVTADGEPTLVGDMDHQAKGLAFAQIPARLGDGIGLYSVESESDQLRLIDPADASTLDSITLNLVPPSGAILGGNGLATHPATGELWGVIRVEGDGGGGGGGGGGEAGGGGPPVRLLTVIDPGTGDAHVVGPLEERFAGITWVGTDGLVCPPVEVVFLMDTSGSMDDEAAALCAAIDAVEGDLGALGIDATTFLYGITEAPGGAFDCLTDTVLDLFGPDVPGDGSCGPLDQPGDNDESWAPATAIVAQEFRWTPGALRVIVPISDEGPCLGSCTDGLPESEAAIANAIVLANINGVTVSPIVGNDPEDCVVPLATELAEGTGGTVFESTDPKLDLAAAIVALVLDACESIGDCNNNGIPDDVETEPQYELDEDAQATPECEDAPFIGPGITYMTTTVTDASFGPAFPDYFFCGLYVGVIDVFYQYTPAWDGLAFVSVEGPPVDFVYGVYDACPPTRESLIDCNEIDHFEIIFHAEKGTTYWIRVAAQFFQEAPFELHMVGPDPAFNPVDCNGNGIPDECECLADVDGDGFITPRDAALVTVLLGTSCDGCPEDVDGDGEVDVRDLEIIFEQMGQACPFGDGGT
ncbi:MAG: hypothetical protein HKO59_10875 [Phycisphaerales bacterium]|nr:hypothetical protein [Phycisphaerales bacterium]